MKKLIISLLLVLAPAYAQAQVVGQGDGGSSAWLVTGPLTDIQIRATPLPVTHVNFANLNVMFSDFIGTEFDVTNHTKSIQIGGTASGTGGEWHAAFVTSTTPGATAYGLVVRDPSALSVNGSGLNTTGYGINAYSRSDSVVHSVESRDSAPLGTEYALLTRLIWDLQLTQLHNTIPNPTRSLQLGGASADGGTNRHVGVSNAEPGANDVGLFVRNITGMQAPGSAAPNLQHVIAGRDPNTNAVRQIEVLPSAPAGTEGGVIVRPITSSLPLPAGASTSALQTTGNTSLGSIKTNTDPLVASGAGGYVRQDSTATIAKETGGNLATVKTNTDPLVASGAGGFVRQDSTATIAKETGGNLAASATSLASIDGKLTAPLSTVSKVALTANSPATASVGVASASALAANASRKGLVIVNVSNAKVCIGIGSAAVIDNGICLQPDASWSMNEYSFATGAINAIASAAASPISIQEFQ